MARILLMAFPLPTTRKGGRREAAALLPDQGTVHIMHHATRHSVPPTTSMDLAALSTACRTVLMVPVSFPLPAQARKFWRYVAVLVQKFSTRWSSVFRCLAFP